MLKTEINDGICLIMVKAKDNNMMCLKNIKEELLKRKIKIFYASATSFFGNGESVVIAINENDVYPLLSALGCIKEKAQIINYSLNCSNSMISWEGAGFDPALHLGDALKDIKLIFESGRCGSLICESEKKHKVIARIDNEK